MTVPPTRQSSDTESHPPQSMMEALKGVVRAMPMASTLVLRFVHAEPGRVEVGIPVSEAFSFRLVQLQATAVFRWPTLRRWRQQAACCHLAGPMPLWTSP